MAGILQEKDIENDARHASVSICKGMDHNEMMMISRCEGIRVDMADSLCVCDFVVEFDNELFHISWYRCRSHANRPLLLLARLAVRDTNLVVAILSRCDLVVESVVQHGLGLEDQSLRPRFAVQHDTVDHEAEGLGMVNDFSARADDIRLVCLPAGLGEGLQVLLVGWIPLINVNTDRIATENILTKLSGDLETGASSLNEIGTVYENGQRPLKLAPDLSERNATLRRPMSPSDDEDRIQPQRCCFAPDLVGEADGELGAGPVWPSEGKSLLEAFRKMIHFSGE